MKNKNFQIEKMRNIIQERWEEVLKVAEAREPYLRKLQKYLKTSHHNINY